MMWLCDRLDKGFEYSTTSSEMLQAITDESSDFINLYITNGQKPLEMRHLLISNHGEATGMALATIVATQIQQCDEENLNFFSTLLPVPLSAYYLNSKLHTKITSVISPEDAEVLSEPESFERDSAESAPIKAASHKVERPQNIKQPEYKRVEDDAA